MMDFVDLDIMASLLQLGGCGFVVGVLMPFGFRLVGWVIDSVITALR